MRKDSKNDVLINLENMSKKYENVMDIEVNFSTYLGDVFMDIHDVVNLNIGSIIFLNKPAGESVDVSINDRTIGHGEIIVYEKNLAIRLNEILDYNEIIYYLTQEK